MEVVRAYKIKLYPNKQKYDTARYTIMRFNQYMNMFLGRLYFGDKRISTKGMGDLANKALYKSRKIVRSLKKAQDITGHKTNVPYANNCPCLANVEKSNESKFDYFIFVPNQWKKRGGVTIPAKSHKALNKSLRDGWKMSELCEIKIINEELYAYVFVSKEVPKKQDRPNMIGLDVGVKHSVVCSDGYLGHGLSKVINVQKQRHAERRRQGHKVSSLEKSHVKQILDREAKLAIRRSYKHSANISIEAPNRLKNLARGNLQGWSTRYFANRLSVLGKENGIKVVEVSPYNTSVTCPECGHVDKQNRVSRDNFVCNHCKYSGFSDIVAARNIALKGIRKHQSGLKSE